MLQLIFLLNFVVILMWVLNFLTHFRISWVVNPFNGCLLLIILMIFLFSIKKKKKKKSKGLQKLVGCLNWMAANLSA